MAEALPPTEAASPRPRASGLRRLLASVRLRMLLGYVLLLSLALSAAILLTRQVQLARADREIEIEQAQEVEELRLLAGGRDPETGQPFGGDVRALFFTFLERNVPSDDEAFYTIVDGAGYYYSTASPNLFDDPQFLPAWLVDEPTRWTTSTAVDGIGEVRTLAVPVLVDGETVGVFVVASFPADDYGEVDQLVTVIAFAGLAVVAITTALAWSLAARVLRPVRDLTTTARQITETDLSARIPVDGLDELAELGDTFNDMVDRLDLGFASQRRFLDDVAHELRTPITIARGHLEVLASQVGEHSGETGDDQAETLETIEIVTDELDRMSRYVNDLLLLAKAEQPDFLVLGEVDLGELALDLQARVGALAPRSWVLDAAPPVGQARIAADAERLTQAVLNLAGNATQYTAAGDEIGIGVALDGDVARLWVRDTGPGVEPAVAETLFHRYARGANSRTRRPDGSGIGLSIVDVIARAHGGSATLENRPGEGATFIVRVPVGSTLPPRVETRTLHPAPDDTRRTLS